jgi:hypothetical protein
MLKSIWNWLTGVEHSAEGIITDLTNKVKTLEQHAADKLVEAEHHDWQADLIFARRDAAAYEAAKVKKVATKIKALVS